MASFAWQLANNATRTLRVSHKTRSPCSSPRAHTTYIYTSYPELVTRGPKSWVNRCFCWVRILFSHKSTERRTPLKLISHRYKYLQVLILCLMRACSSDGEAQNPGRLEWSPLYVAKRTFIWKVKGRSDDSGDVDAKTLGHVNRVVLTTANPEDGSTAWLQCTGYCCFILDEVIVVQPTRFTKQKRCFYKGALLPRVSNLPVCLWDVKSGRGKDIYINSQNATWKSIWALGEKWIQKW